MLSRAEKRLDFRSDICLDGRFRGKTRKSGKQCEENIPTEQHTTQKNSWIPGPNADPRWEACPQAEKGKRTPTPVGLKRVASG